jgi:hypothetical protein
LTGEEILNLPMGENDAGAETIRDYLKALLRKLWREGEGFGGKRPFGNSGWEWELYKALAVGCAIDVLFDDYGDMEEISDFQERKANALIFDAIEALQ